MSNEYFNPASVPAPNAPGSSAVMRAEIARIAAAFDLMPVMAGSQGEFVVVDPTGTRLVASGFSFPDLVSVSGVQTLTNKTFAWADNTWSGFGTGATKNAGTGADEVLLLAEANKLPALDAWNLTNINPASVANAVVAFGINLKADANNAVLTGAPVAPTPATADNSARIATTAFVQEAVVAAGGATPSNANPVMNGVAAPGVANQVSRHDHVHPTDTSRAPASAATAAGTGFAPDAGIAATNVQGAIVELVADVDGKLALKAPIDSPTFTGAPKAPTPLTASNDTSIATTAFTQALIAQQPTGMRPSNSNPLMNGVAAPGTGVEASRHDHVHPTDTSRAPASAGTAAGTSFTPTGTLSATDVQGAIVELLGETATAAQGAKADTALQPAAIGTWVQATLVSGTNIKTINGESVLGSGNVSVQATLISGTNIKTINGASVLGAGDIAIAGGTGATSPTGSLPLPAGTSSQRDASPLVGYVRFNTDFDLVEVYDGTEWLPVGARATYATVVDYLVIAGGGGGGGETSAGGGGGGGGAGGYRTSFGTSGGGVGAEPAFAIESGTAYNVIIGAGGPGAPASRTSGTAGSPSTFATITSAGGGLGATQGTSGGSGGSGGGAGWGGTSGGTGTANQGTSGSVGVSNSAGGGGGASTGGGVATATVGGAGGDGLSSSITGTAVTRAGGGAGGSYSATVSSGGSGGGGAGGSNGTPAGGNGTASTGSGGGGGGGTSGTKTGGNGGSGIVILRYSANLTCTIGAGLTGSTVTVGDDKVTTITAGSGTVTWTY